MGINQMILDHEVVLNLEHATVTPNKLEKGTIAIDSKGNYIVGTMLTGASSYPDVKIPPLTFGDLNSNGFVQSEYRVVTNLIDVEESTTYTILTNLFEWDVKVLFYDATGNPEPEFFNIYSGGTITTGRKTSYIRVSAYGYNPDQTTIIIKKYEEETTSSNVITPTLESGTISRTDGSLSSSSTYVRTSEFIPTNSGDVNVFNNNVTSNNMVVFYDENYNFIYNWNDNYSYRYVNNGSTLETPSRAKYMKVRISASDPSTTTLTITKQ